MLKFITLAAIVGTLTTHGGYDLRCVETEKDSLVIEELQHHKDMMGVVTTYWRERSGYFYPAGDLKFYFKNEFYTHPHATIFEAGWSKDLYYTKIHCSQCKTECKIYDSYPIYEYTCSGCKYKFIHSQIDCVDKLHVGSTKRHIIQYPAFEGPMFTAPVKYTKEQLAAEAKRYVKGFYSSLPDNYEIRELP